ncbi:NUDIX domain-containing protein [Patescibacteria group bacterium]|nr:NUDIX domain-containing protein [Patescibacteria group bacterium]
MATIEKDGVLLVLDAQGKESIQELVSYPKGRPTEKRDFAHPNLVLRGPETFSNELTVFDMEGNRVPLGALGGFRLVMGRGAPINVLEYGAYKEQDGSPGRYAGWIATMASVAVVMVYAMRRRDNGSLELLIGRIHNPRKTSTNPNDPAQEAPRGRIEKGETPTEAGARELLEEVGLDRDLKMLPGKPVNANSAWLSHAPLDDGSPGGFFFVCCEVNPDHLERVEGDLGGWRFDEEAREAHIANRKLEDFEKDIGPMTFRSYKDVINGEDGPTIIAAARLKHWLEDEKAWVFDVPGVRTRM